MRPSERCQSGRMGLTRNQVCPSGHPGFESLPLRHSRSRFCGIFDPIPRDALTPLARTIYAEVSQPNCVDLQASRIDLPETFEGHLWRSNLGHSRLSVGCARPQHVDGTTASGDPDGIAREVDKAGVT